MQHTIATSVSGPLINREAKGRNSADSEFFADSKDNNLKRNLDGGGVSANDDLREDFAVTTKRVSEQIQRIFFNL